MSEANVHCSCCRKCKRRCAHPFTICWTCHVGAEHLIRDGVEGTKHASTN